MSSFIDSYINGVRSIATQVVNTVQRESFSTRLGSGSGSVIPVTIPPPPSSNSGTSTGTVTVVIIFFLLWQIIFAVGGALQSYKYNLMMGTSPVLTVIYVLLCFTFPYIYYPFYTFVLNTDGQTVGQYGGRRKG